MVRESIHTTHRLMVKVKNQVKIKKIIILMVNLDVGNSNIAFTAHLLAKMKRSVHVHSKTANSEGAQPDTAVTHPSTY